MNTMAEFIPLIFTTNMEKIYWKDVCDDIWCSDDLDIARETFKKYMDEIRKE